MASEVDICNLALADLGDRASVSSINPQDGSVQAMHCARFYPMCRDMLLAMPVAWTFATRRVALQAVEIANMPDGWGFAYALPNGCIRPQRVLTPGASKDSDSEPFLTESTSTGSKVIYTNVEDAVLVYTHAVTDPTVFGPLFTVALAKLMSAKLAGPLLKGKEGRGEAQAKYKEFLQVDYPLAAQSEANAQQRDDYADFTPSSIAARA